jgi:hypothetical protein
MRRIFMRFVTAALSGSIFCKSLRHRAPCSEIAMSRPLDKAVAARASGKFIAGTDDHPATDSPAPFWAREPLSAFELERILTLDEVAEFTRLSEDGIRRHWGHLIRRLSPRRVGMKLRDVLTIGTPPENSTPAQRGGSTQSRGRRAARRQL